MTTTAEHKSYSQGDLEKFLAGYLACAVWADSAEGEEWSVDQIATEDKQSALKDCEAFLEEAYPLIHGLDRKTEFSSIYGAAGFDFWLTRAGHGTGFQDGSWPVTGKKLAAVCAKFCPVAIFKGDDGLLYFEGGGQYANVTPDLTK